MANGKNGVRSVVTFVIAAAICASGGMLVRHEVKIAENATRITDSMASMNKKLDILIDRP